MRKALSIFFIGAAFFSVNLVAQELADEPLTLPDSVMEQVVSRILKWNFSPASRPKSVLVAELGIKREWLPAIPNINFQLASENDALKAKNGAFLFEGLQRVGRGYSINVGWGDFECQGFGDVWKFIVGKDDKVRLWRVKDSGWGRGCGGSGPPKIKGLTLGEVSPNEIPGYEFFKKGKLKSIRLGISTKDDMRRIFGDTCESTCDYDESWRIYAEYFEDGVEFSRTGGEVKESEIETEYIPRPEFVDKLQSLRLIPKKRISFLKVSFPRTFGSNERYSIGDDWDENGFAGAVHATATTYADGYGLEYSVFGAETFNNLRNKGPEVKEPVRKGDLTSIEYSIPDSFEDLIFASRPKAREKEGQYSTYSKRSRCQASRKRSKNRNSTANRDSFVKL